MILMDNGFMPKKTFIPFYKRIVIFPDTRLAVDGGHLTIA
jgi:hypothetical protein